MTTPRQKAVDDLATLKKLNRQLRGLGVRELITDDLAVDYNPVDLPWLVEATRRHLLHCAAQLSGLS